MSDKAGEEAIPKQFTTILESNEVRRSLVIQEPILRALLISHLLFGISWVAGFLNEIEDIKYDKKTKQVTFTFSKKVEEHKK